MHSFWCYCCCCYGIVAPTKRESRTDGSVYQYYTRYIHVQLSPVFYTSAGAREVPSHVRQLACSVDGDFERKFFGVVVLLCCLTLLHSFQLCFMTNSPGSSAARLVNVPLLLHLRLPDKLLCIHAAKPLPVLTLVGGLFVFQRNMSSIACSPKQSLLSRSSPPPRIPAVCVALSHTVSLCLGHTRQEKILCPITAAGIFPWFGSTKFSRSRVKGRHSMPVVHCCCCAERGRPLWIADCRARCRHRPVDRRRDHAEE